MATTNDPLSDVFENSLGELKRERLAALDAAAGVQVLMESLLQHEARRIESKLGPEHPRTQQLKARLSLQLARRLEVEHHLMRIEVPAVAEDGALVHGRVVDEDGRGIDGLTIRLVDKAGAPVRDASEPTTDASGYFAIPLEAEAVDRIVEQHPDGVFLTVLTTRQHPVHHQARPLEIDHGARLFSEIHLDPTDLTAKPSPDTVVVTDLVGKTEKEALAALRKVGLVLGRREAKVAPDQAGRVLEQSPPAGEKVAPGTAVSLVIAEAETKTVPVPNLVGVRVKTAKRKIKVAGLELAALQGSSPTDSSIVESQEPLPEVEVPPGTPVTLTVQGAQD